MYDRISKEEESTGKEIVNAAYQIHKELEPGLLEKEYEVCFFHVLKSKGLRVNCQSDVPIVFESVVSEEGLRSVFVVNDLVICELKASVNIIPVLEAQLISHLKLTNKHLGYFINFNVPVVMN